MNFIGDLSRQDADVLEEYGHRSPRILEFGAGGSTQIFAQCQPMFLISVETAQVWIDRTKKNLARFQPCTDPIFVQYDEHPIQEFDLIFVDGFWDLRLDFARKTWPLLRRNGVMIFHDTRRSFDAENVFKIAKTYWDEVGKIYMNLDDSNCSVIYKCPKVKYENWNETEGKEPWMYGQGDPPEGE